MCILLTIKFLKWQEEDWLELNLDRKQLAHQKEMVTIKEQIVISFHQGKQDVSIKNVKVVILSRLVQHVFYKFRLANNGYFKRGQVHDDKEKKIIQEEGEENENDNGVSDAEGGMSQPNPEKEEEDDGEQEGSHNGNGEL